MKSYVLVSTFDNMSILFITHLVAGDLRQNTRRNHLSSYILSSPVNANSSTSHGLSTPTAERSRHQQFHYIFDVFSGL